jgi:oxygen-independent coproporphyrinogen-3 oxidase
MNAQPVPDPWSLPYGPHLYVHIPFCRARCRYCDFVSYAGREEAFSSYVQCLCREIIRTGPQAVGQSPVGPATLYIGGGTPTVLPPAGLAALLRACAQVLDLAGAEVTIEANPGTVSAEPLRSLRALGVNRLSLGVQSFSDAALRLLGRIHTAEEAHEAYAGARQAGFAQVNLDLIFGLPGQALDAWQMDLERAIALEPEHISLYSLTLEEDTPLMEAVARGELPAPDEDQAAEMYAWTEDRLEQAGYLHYEISNWARPGCWSRHNIAYWRNEDYAGCGAAAHSHQGRRRWANTASLEEYMAALRQGRLPVAEEEELDLATAMGETMMLGLRLVAGVPYAEFARRYGASVVEVYGPIVTDLTAQGLLLCDDAAVRLSPRGRLLGNQVFARLLP